MDGKTSAASGALVSRWRAIGILGCGFHQSIRKGKLQGVHAFICMTYCGLSAGIRGIGALTPVFEVMADLAEGPRKAAAGSNTISADKLYQYEGQD